MVKTLVHLPPGARLDLHLHSDRSDGRLSPQEVLTACARAGLQVVALTDHDLAPSLPAGRQSFGMKVLHVLHGAEISGHFEGVELHLLVYFPGPMPSEFQAFCTERARRRADRYAEAAARLALPGLPPPDEDARAGRRSLTRTHLSHAIVQAGHAPDLYAAFERYTGSQHGAIPLIDLPFEEALRVARAAGGVTSWAHPGLEQAKRWLPDFKRAGLQGIEGLRPSLKSRDRNEFRHLAAEHGLFLTGGSDYHGWGSERLGSFSVPKRELGGFLSALSQAQS